LISPPTATTKSPTNLALADIFTELFNLGLAKSDLSTTITTFRSLLTTLSVNTTQVDSYVSALQAYLAVVVENPTPEQAAEMTAKLDLFDAAEENFIQSFEGMATALADPFFLVNPLNIVFNALRVAAVAAKATLRITPFGTYAFFTSPLTITAFADYTAMAIETSIRIR
jgi:hypothetical protein